MNDTSPCLPGTEAAGAHWWGLLCLPLVLVTAAGNILVCVAISRERRLQNMTNYFLMSLAITDLMVAVLVMPLGIVVLVLGRFPLPPIYCMLWTLLDVLFCTASIMHLCTLSVDRYLSLSFPMRFGRHKTRRRVLLKLVPVWLLSVSQSVPLCLIYARDHQAVLVDGVCAVPEPLFQLVGSVVCFYIPLLVMLVTYALTVRMLHRKQMELGSPPRVSPPTVTTQMVTSAVTHRTLGPLSARWWRTLLDRLNTKCPLEEMECTDFSVCATNSAYASVANSRHLMVRPGQRDAESYGTFTSLPQRSQDEGHARSGTFAGLSLRSQDEGRARSGTFAGLPQRSQDEGRARSGTFTGLPQRPQDEGRARSGTFAGLPQRSQDEGRARSGTFAGLPQRSQDEGRARSGTFTGLPRRSQDEGRARSGSVCQLSRPAAVGTWEVTRRRGLSRSEQHLSSVAGAALLRASSASSPGSADSVLSLHYQTLESPASPPAQLVTSLSPDGGGAAVTAVVSNGYTLPVPTLPVPTLRGRAASAPKERSLLVRLQSVRSPTPLQRTAGPLRATCRAGSRPNLRAEQKATKVLGIIFFTFVLLWSPFFIINVVLPLCVPCRRFITVNVINFATWLGYISSLVNPIFYTLFNKTFRNAFLRILRCR